MTTQADKMKFVKEYVKIAQDYIANKSEPKLTALAFAESIKRIKLIAAMPDTATMLSSPLIGGADARNIGVIFTSSHPDGKTQFGFNNKSIFDAKNARMRDSFMFFLRAMNQTMAVACRASAWKWIATVLGIPQAMGPHTVDNMPDTLVAALEMLQLLSEHREKVCEYVRCNAERYLEEVRLHNPTFCCTEDPTRFHPDMLKKQAGVLDITQPNNGMWRGPVGDLLARLLFALHPHERAMPNNAEVVQGMRVCIPNWLFTTTTATTMTACGVEEAVDKIQTPSQVPYSDAVLSFLANQVLEKAKIAKETSPTTPMDIATLVHKAFCDAYGSVATFNTVETNMTGLAQTPIAAPGRKTAAFTVDPCIDVVFAAFATAGVVAGQTSVSFVTCMQNEINKLNTALPPHMQLSAITHHMTTHLLKVYRHALQTPTYRSALYTSTATRTLCTANGIIANPAEVKAVVEAEKERKEVARAAAAAERRAAADAKAVADTARRVRALKELADAKFQIEEEASERKRKRQTDSEEHRRRVMTAREGHEAALLRERQKLRAQLSQLVPTAPPRRIVKAKSAPFRSPSGPREQARIVVLASNNGGAHAVNNMMSLYNLDMSPEDKARLIANVTGDHEKGEFSLRSIVQAKAPQGFLLVASDSNEMWSKRLEKISDTGAVADICKLKASEMTASVRECLCARLALVHEGMVGMDADKAVFSRAFSPESAVAPIVDFVMQKRSSILHACERRFTEAIACIDAAISRQHQIAAAMEAMGPPPRMSTFTSTKYCSDSDRDRDSDSDSDIDSDSDGERGVFDNSDDDGDRHTSLTANVSRDSAV